LFGKCAGTKLAGPLHDEKVLRFFPVWPKEKDARFGNLRAVGAFLVSGELKDGQVRHVTIVSEKGRESLWLPMSNAGRRRSQLGSASSKN